MKLVRILIWLVTSALLTACNLLQSKEEQCLQSARLEMKDPDSAKLVGNLGDRGDEMIKVHKGFWIRYTATNSYGARVSGSMACKESAGKWVRSRATEDLVTLTLTSRIQGSVIAAQNEKMRRNMAEAKVCKTSACRAANQLEWDLMLAEQGGADNVLQWSERKAAREAKEIVDGSGDIPQE